MSARSAPKANHGLALVAVLWMVAALSLLAAGLAGLTRGELRVAQNVRVASEVAALGDAAIQLVALAIRSEPGEYQGRFVLPVPLGDREVVVRVVPVGGLIDLNAAGEPLLRDLFVFAAGRDEGEAEQIARNIAEWRGGGGDVDGSAYEEAGMSGGPRGGRFEYPEDLLQVLGVSYDDYANIERLITVSSESPSVDPLLAPVEVLQVLANGDAEMARTISEAREAEDPAVDTTGLVQEYIGGRGAGILRVDAEISFGGRDYRRTRWIDPSRPSVEGSPWRTVRIEAVRGARVRAEFDDGV